MTGRKPEDRNRTIVHRFIEEVLNAGNLDAAEQLIGDDFVSHGWRGSDRGREAVVSFARSQRAGAPDWHIQIHDTIASGDRVAVRATGGGTWLVANEMIAPDLVGRRLAIDWIAVYRLAGG